MKPKFMSVAEAAARKGVSRSAIYKAIADGRLKSQEVIGKLALRESDINNWQPSPSPGRRKGSKLNEDAKARISEGQKRRWGQRNKHTLSLGKHAP